jgi:hypothetical protein
VEEILWGQISNFDNQAAAAARSQTGQAVAHRRYPEGCCGIVMAIGGGMRRSGSGGGQGGCG